MNQEDYKIQIDNWLRKTGIIARRKVWVVVFRLDLEWQLRDSNEFNIPLVKLLDSPLVNKEDLVAILTNLHNKGIIMVNRYLGEWKTQKELSDSLQGPKFTTIELDQNIVDFPDTKIRIVRDRFNYLKAWLRKIAELYANQNQTQSFIKKPEWRNNFKLDEKDFVFGDYGRINFTSKDREYLFKQLFDAKGGWVTVQKLKGEKDDGFTRSTIKQIEDLLKRKTQKHIEIPSTQDDGLEPKPSQGAYRLRFTEQPK